MNDLQRRESEVIRKARRLVQDIGISSVPVNLEPFVAAANAKIKIFQDMDDKESGQTAQMSGKNIIFVNGNHRKERQRFTVLHEIAHILLDLPSKHHGPDALMRYRHRPPEEVLCDLFAAECLLPHDFFSEDVRNTDISMDAVKALAARYQASLTMTGSRFAANANEPCAFVLSEAGRVRYVSRSKRLSELKGWIAVNSPLPEGSVAHHLTQSPSKTEECDELESDVWFDGGIRSYPILTEEAILLREWNQCLSLIWLDQAMIPPGERMDYDEDESPVEELDGTLPWPSGRRRR